VARTEPARHTITWRGAERPVDYQVALKG
jgi:hypothetical protein